jgi:hypothetical protein
MKPWIKSLISGLAGSLIMFILMMIAINGVGIAPFDMPPSAAFLKSLGITPKPLALIIHFGYGAIAAIFLHEVFKNKSKVVYGIGLAIAMWLIMMFVLSPIIGWGILGTNAGTIDGALALSSTPKYIISTLILHIIYGLTIGLIQKAWINNKSDYNFAQ